MGSRPTRQRSAAKMGSLWLLPLEEPGVRFGTAFFASCTVCIIALAMRALANDTTSPQSRLRPCP